MGAVRRTIYWPYGAAAGSTTVVGTPGQFTIGSGSLTVPNDVTPDMTAVIWFGTADNGAVNATLTSPGATITKWDERAAGNMRVAVYVGTGLTAGQTITFTGTVKSIYVAHVYTDTFTVDGASLSAGTRPGSQATTTSGAIVPDPGQQVLVLAAERTLADGTAVSSVVPSTGETVGQITFSEEGTATDVSLYLGKFTANDATSRTVTITYTTGSGNGYAAVVLLDSGSGRLVFAGRC